jgi:S-adenosylmethionine synthetase
MKKDNLLNDMRRPLFGGLNSAAEFVTPGHPDKTCDQIAGKILDHVLKLNQDASVAIEMVACNGKIVIGGEVSEDVYGKIPYSLIAKSTFNGMGYEGDNFDVNVLDIVNKQSKDIAQGDDKSGVKADDREGVGAGDQGVMCGYAMYAPDREHMPAAFWYSQRLAMRLFDVAITDKKIPGLFADGKTQVIITDGKISDVTIAIQHGIEWKGKERQKELKNEIIKHVIIPVAGEVPSVILNGTGNFEKGSIWADSAEVGRKIVVDQMGPDIPVGGGTLNGKDPSKVDLTATVMARYIAKNIVAHELADEALVQFAFTIGKDEPDQINVYTVGWKPVDITAIEWVRKNFKTKVIDMIEELGMKNPTGWSYEEAAKFGYYGHPKFPWENIKQLG